MVHAHPKFGGSPDMMHALAADMASHGVQVLNLSLRGCGDSGGANSWVGDAGEVQDVVAAADYARTTLHAAHVHLFGYSFGATVAGAALDARAFISTYTAVAYPLGHWWARGFFGLGAKLMMHHHTHELKQSIKPKLFLLGTRDDFTSRESIGKFASHCLDPWSLKVYPGADHFAFVSSPWAEEVAGDVREFVLHSRGYVEASAGVFRSSARGDVH